jgi:predicted AAA+ superfamily ATPase
MLSSLKKWLHAQDRKPLVIRGARQVGKTWLTRHFAKISGLELIEINFERHLSVAGLFESNEPKQILLNLSANLVKNIDPKNSLLFLDEIQAAPQILSKLRWFAEDMPELAIIATGSLLEFVLEEHSFSMPVGRISYMHLEPLSFAEFLSANEKNPLNDYLEQYQFDATMPIMIHEQLMSLFKEYMLVGGLPAAVAAWISERSLSKVNQVHHDLLATYQDDFAKYRNRIPLERLEDVMKTVPKMLGNKFVYSRVNPLADATSVKKALHLLTKAKICHYVQSCAANGVPLGGEVNEKFFKVIFLDTGLCSAHLGLNLNELIETKEIILINNGGISEQIVGQLLRTINPPYIEPSLYYWTREEKGANAEIDYVIQFGSKVIPIEVKSGSTGSLKSLHLFMQLKKLSFALRINSDLPSKVKVNVKDASGEMIEYTLLSIPFYLCHQVYRLLNHIMQ